MSTSLAWIDAGAIPSQVRAGAAMSDGCLASKHYKRQACPRNMSGCAVRLSLNRV